ncbi:LacI family transcriptional regulator [Capsulimonas corticalis]|uniref:LacI family transcriptional regulator n=1 Tax=Capsulimonas corticalis TaxID=2219043 RepID=A0A402CVJ8_9BACT|nr:GntR family transcriptional regulator [Capsulimonas corticalis]BDI30462.1 LacI family transcriptional regulator [Capsulimonas corticalis]
MNSLASVELLDNLIINQRTSDMPLYAQVRLALSNLIDEYFDDGEQFWTEAVLTERLGVSKITIRRAMQELSREGVLVRRVSKGTVVRKSDENKTTDYRVGIIAVCLGSEASINDLIQECQNRGRRADVFYVTETDTPSSIFAKVEHSPRQIRFILLANPTDITRDLQRTFSQWRYHTVNIDTLIAGYPGAFVGVDDAAGIRLGVDHLIALGHRRITLLVNEPMSHGTIVTRVNTFDDYTRENQILEARVVHCSTSSWKDSFQAAYDNMPAVMGQRITPTAIFTVSDAGAFGVLKWCAENGVRVPQEVSVLGFDNISTGKFTQPALSTIAQPHAEIVQKALDLLHDASDEPTHVLLPPTLLIRESTASVNS